MQPLCKTIQKVLKKLKKKLPSIVVTADIYPKDLRARSQREKIKESQRGLTPIFIVAKRWKTFSVH